MLQARNIHKRFGDLEVLKGIDICIPQGKVTAIVGPSGAGKTTLLQILGTLSAPEAGGSVTYDSVEVTAMNDRRLSRFRNRNIGFVFQFHQATYGMQNIVNSISLLLTAGSSIYFDSLAYRTVTETTFLFLPIMVWVAVIVFIVVWVVLRKTKFGTNIHGLGGNKEALTLAGINPVKCMIKTFAFAGMIAGIAGVIALCRVESGQPTVATGWEFQAVAATLLGGTSLREGKGGVTGTIFGVLLIQIIKNGLNVVGVQSIYQNAIIGSIILAAIIIDAVVRIRSEK